MPVALSPHMRNSTNATTQLPFPSICVEALMAVGGATSSCENAAANNYDELELIRNDARWSQTDPLAKLLSKIPGYNHGNAAMFRGLCGLGVLSPEERATPAQLRKRALGE